MRDPRKLYTEDGLKEFLRHLYNFQESIFYFQNDDMHIGCNDRLEEEWLDGASLLASRLEGILEGQQPGCSCD